MTENPLQPRRELAGRLPPIPADLVRLVGEALYGPEWVSQLAAALGIARTTVQRWKGDETRVTPMIAGDLVRLLNARGAAQAAALAALAPYAERAAREKAERDA